MAARKDRGRLPNGAGSIYQRASDSKWVGATYVLTTDGTRHRKVVYGATWEEAQRFANGRLAAGHTPTTVHTMIATLGAA